MADSDRMGRFIYGFHCIANPERLRGLHALRPLPADLAKRDAALAQRFDAVPAD